jgi:hypothetical protein
MGKNEVDAKGIALKSSHPCVGTHTPPARSTLAPRDYM